MAALNGLDIHAAGIGNIYLNAKTNEQEYTTAGPEFVIDKGKTNIIVRALYGLKSSGAAWRSHFSHTLLDMSFSPTYLDPDVWMQPATKSTGNQYYEHVLVDEDIL